MNMSSAQAEHWDSWNSKYRGTNALDGLDLPCRRRMQEVLAALKRMRPENASVLEVGCGTGWLSSRLTEFGIVTGVDLGKEIIDAAKKEHPEIDFRSGDIHTVDLPLHSFDVIVTLETFSHVPDQEAFVRRLAALLKPKGVLLLTTQNKYVFDRVSGIGPPIGYLRKWVDMRTLKRLLGCEFDLRQATTLEPEGHLGLLRLVNSFKVSRILDSFFGSARVKQLKEAAGFGQTIFIVAERR
jgi:2-polyprenyl-3-methyl-5-hydroxy-6-metoxy-1,4-benzoquinol methylase